MRRIVGGLALAGLFGVGCGHAQVTGSAKNDWSTPTGHAQATDPVKVDPMAGSHPAHDRSAFARREAPSLQPAGTAVEEPMPMAEPPIAPADRDVVPPATVTPMPPLDAAPDIPTPSTQPGGIEAPPPYVLPPP